MSAGRLIGELQAAGVVLWEDDGRLRFRAAKGTMTPERLAALREHRDEVLAHLRGPADAVLVPAPEDRYEPFPVTDVQSAYLLGRRDLFAYGGVACHGYGELSYPDLDPARLEAAWRRLVGRHDMLRAVVSADGAQQVLPSVPDYAVAVTDLRGAPDAQVEEAVVATRAEMDHRVYEPDVWPLFDLRITRATGRAVLHFSIDFLIADFVSIEVLLDELHRVYAAPDVALPPLEVTYRDYRLAERRIRSGVAFERDQAYWLDRIDDLPPPPDLPVTAHPEAGAAPRFARHELRLGPAEWAGLRERAGSAGVSPSSAVLAAFAETLAAWSRTPRFTVDVTLLNRLPVHPQVDRLVGDFTSVSLLAVDRAAGATFAARAAAVQAQLWEDLDHRLFSGIEVMREVGRRRGPGAALMPIVFTSAIGLAGTPAGADGATAPGGATAAGTDGTTAAADGASPARGALTYGISQTPQVWIDCQNIERDGGLVSNWDVREGVLPDAVVADAFAAFEDLLRRLAADTGEWATAHPLRIPAGQLARRDGVKATAAPLPDGLLQDGFLAHAGRTPDRTAVVAGERTLDYGEVDARSAGVAARLRAHGLAPGEPVAVVMDKGWEQVVAVLGVLRAGGAYLPVDTNQPPARRRRILADAGVRLVLTQSWVGVGADDLAPATRPASTPDGVATADGATAATDGATAAADGTAPDDRVRAVLAVDGIPPADPATVPAPATAPDDLAYVIYTSGSTGVPKGVMITHRAARNTMDDVSARFGVGADDRVLGLANLGFDLSVYDVFGVLGVGGALVLPDPERRGDPSHWADLVVTSGVTVWNSVPAQMQMLGDYLAVAPHVAPTTLRLALLSGDWIPVALPGQLRTRLPGLRLVGLGGATEAAIWSIFHEIGEVPAEWRSIPYGRPLANQTFAVLDAAFRPVPDLVPGELFIGGAGLALGYLGDAERTAERFVAHPATGERLYRTGDLGRYLPDGEIEFLGREDLQVKVHGHRIELAEIEAVLASHPAVDGAVCVAEGPVLDRQLAAFVEPARTQADATRGTAGTNGTGAGTPDLGAETRAVLDAADATGAGVLDGVDRDRYLAYTRHLDDLALTGMLTVLADAGLFAGGSAPTAEEVLAGAGVADRHRRLVRRWLHTLVGEGVLARDDDDRHTLTPAGAARLDVDTDAGWQEVVDLGAGIDDVRLVDYFRSSGALLGELVRGEQDPLGLLFPEGRVELSDNLYADALFNRWANTVTADTVRRIAAAHRGPGPLRVLEVGAGAGGTTAAVLDELDAARDDGVEVDYLCTDLSPFFLNAARERFAGRPGLRFAVYDLDDDARAQGLSPNAFDVVVAGDVVHATRDAGATLRRLAELAAPGAWLVVQEMTRDHFQVMTSLELLVRLDATVGDFTDVRRGRHATFLDPAQWGVLLHGAGADAVESAPRGDDLLEEIGMRVMVARFKGGRARVTPAELDAYAAERLPGYMVPPTVQVVDAIPVTDNGKVDRARLLTWLPARGGPTAVADDAGASDLELRLAAIWADVLPVEHVDRHQNFYDLGGDSLLAAQLAGRLTEDVPEADLFFDELLRLILDRPTVASLAAGLLAARPDAGAGPDGDAGAAFAPGGGDPADAGLVHLGGADAGVTRVLVHDGTGRLDATLAAALGAGGPVLGLAGDAGLPVADLAPAELLDRLAGGYAADLVATGVDRALVVGPGAGATVALEVARRLTEAGVEVRGLLLVEPATAASAPAARNGNGRAAGNGRAGTAHPGGHAGGTGTGAAATDSDVDGADGASPLRDALLRAAAEPGGDVYVGDATVVVPAAGGTGDDPARTWAERCLGEVTVVRAPDGARSPAPDWVAALAADVLGETASLPADDPTGAPAPGDLAGRDAGDRDGFGTPETAGTHRTAGTP